MTCRSCVQSTCQNSQQRDAHTAGPRTGQQNATQVGSGIIPLSEQQNHSARHPRRHPTWPQPEFVRPVACPCRSEHHPSSTPDTLAISTSSSTGTEDYIDSNTTRWQLSTRRRAPNHIRYGNMHLRSACSSAIETCATYRARQNTAVTHAWRVAGAAVCVVTCGAAHPVQTPYPNM